MWQSFRYSQSGWQEKLSDAELGMLVKFGRRTDEFGYLILSWTLDNWDTFTTSAVGPDKKRSSAPDVFFFCSYEALAFKLWCKHDFGPEESEETKMLIKASESSIVEFEELQTRYTSK